MHDSKSFPWQSRRSVARKLAAVVYAAGHEQVSMSGGPLDTVPVGSTSSILAIVGRNNCAPAILADHSPAFVSHVTLLPSQIWPRVNAAGLSARAG
jgi:hypothetical protein